MASSQTFLGERGKTENRRSCARLPVNWHVLLYFGESNWGKLLNVNESGMCLEFAEPPRTGQNISFSMDSMGRLPMSVEGEVSSEKLTAAGEIKWIREFERMAGVQFTELDEESRNLIEQWLSSGAPLINRREESETKTIAEAPICQVNPPPTEKIQDEALVEAVEIGGTTLELERTSLGIEPVSTLEPCLVEKTLETPAFEACRRAMAEKKQTLESQLELKKKWIARNGLLAVPVCAAILTLLAVLRMIPPVWGRKSEAAERISGLMGAQQIPVNGKYTSRIGGEGPFLVEVQDAKNRRWLLWFDHNSSETVSVQATGPADTYSRPSASKPAARARQSASARRETPHEYSLVRPKVNHSKPNTLSDVPPSGLFTIPDEAPPLGMTPGGILVLGGRAESAVQALPSGGELQPARLIRADPPTYPALAKANRINGEVVLDALIDATGRVTDVKVVAGPNLLRAAALEALQSWKYEPARLRGRPVPTRLNVTVKFHYQ